jgi:mannose/cellobiose epimerase-like protein (N-acyl-D-glucosamine 2-epimerase family)
MKTPTFIFPAHLPCPECIRMFFLLLVFLPGSLWSQDHLSGDFWKRQVEEEILEPWIAHTRDTAYGGYFSTLDRDWQPDTAGRQYPGMIARHLFSFSAAFMMSGNSEYLRHAGETFDYLVRYGWDNTHGGWFTALHRNGEVADDGKDLFMQTYAITGLAMYYLVTRNERVRSFLDRSIDFIEDKAWDRAHGGGYVHSLHRDGTIADSNKRFSPQLAPLSGYLLYLHSATREKKYLRMAERILDTVLEHMYDPSCGWILEGFDREWQPIEQENTWMNTGHNLEVAWMLLRLHRFNGRADYYTKALELSDRLIRHVFDPESGYWYHRAHVDDPSVRTGDCPWWVQAYGNMHMLYLHRATGDSKYLDYFSRGAAFWNQHFVDHASGGAFLSVDPAGLPLDARKAVATKTSYHSVEHGLLNWLYLDLWVHRKEVTLYYFPAYRKTGAWYPMPVEELFFRSEAVGIDGNGQGTIQAKLRKGRLKVSAVCPVEVKLAVRDP